MRAAIHLEGSMLIRGMILLILLSLPLPVHAATYVVRQGDTLATIAQRYHISITTLASVNHLSNVNVIRIGQALVIPTPRRVFSYRVRWGDTLLGVSARYNISLSTIRSLNPTLGQYLIAGQLLRLCGPCGGTSGYTHSGSTAPAAPAAPVATSSGTVYIVRPGDTLSGVAAQYGVTASALMAANRIVNPNLIVIGSRLVIPAASSAPAAGTYATYDPWTARSLIGTYAAQYGIEPALALAVGWQESGFNQTLVSRTGAVGVMQVEPYTGQHIAWLWGRPVNLYLLDDNIHAGVYWLATLVRYYAGNEQLAIAAYYQGTANLARYGYFRDTVQYVNNVMSLKTSFGG